MAHAIDLFVDRAFLLDIGVGAGHIGFGLVVIVIRDEILDRIVGKKAPELAIELRRQGLVGGEHESRALRSLDHLGHGESLAGTGDAQQHLIALPVTDAKDELGDCLRLIALGLVVGDDASGGGRLRSSQDGAGDEV